MPRVVHKTAEEAPLVTHLMIGLLDWFYPEHEITVTSSDPPYVTPTVKAMLRRKNCLMRAGRTEEAGAIACRVLAPSSRATARSGCAKSTPARAPRTPGQKYVRSLKGRSTGWRRKYVMTTTQPYRQMPTTAHPTPRAPRLKQTTQLNSTSCNGRGC